MSDDAPVMMMTLSTMTCPHLVTRGQTLLKQTRPVTEAPATVHLLPAGQAAGAAIGQTWNMMYGQYRWTKHSTGVSSRVRISHSDKLQGSWILVDLEDT